MDHSDPSSFQVKGILREAWHLVKGSKGPIWAIAIWISIIPMLLGIIWSVIYIGAQENPASLPIYHLFLALPVLNSIISAPFFAGSIMVAVKRARNEPVTGKSGYQYFHKTGALMVTMLIISVAANIVNYLFHLPQWNLTPNALSWLNALGTLITILVYTFTILSLPLVVDQNYSPLKALSASLSLTRKHWARILLVFIILYLIARIASIHFSSSLSLGFSRGIGLIILIWFLPFFFLVIGVSYARLSGKTTSDWSSRNQPEKWPSTH